MKTAFVLPRMLSRCAMLSVLGMALHAGAQTLTVRLLNGKTGKPIRDQNVTLDWDYGKTSIVLRVDRHGVAHVTVPVGARWLGVSEGPRKGPESYRVAYFDCNRPALVNLDVAAILAHGYVAGDDCGRRVIVPQPGEIIFWGMLRPWWIPDLQ